MTARTGMFGLRSVLLVACLSWASGMPAQQIPSPKNPASNDSRSALVAQYRERLNETSVSATAAAGIAARVFYELLQQVKDTKASHGIVWELRILEGRSGNAFSLPDGAIFVDRAMAQMLGEQAGLWAAVLAHEMVHVMQHHWSKRVVYQESLKGASSGWGRVEMGAFAAGPRSSEMALSEEVMALSRDLEIEADAGSLNLMAQAGFHPDFVMALYHLMEIQDTQPKSFLATHPGWKDREANLKRKYGKAMAEFARLWPEPEKSPGGTAPALAFLGKLHAETKSGLAEIEIPLRCENVVGQVDVVLLLRQGAGTAPQELRKAASCGQERSVLTFELGAQGKKEEAQAEMQVLDERGWMLARSEPLKFRF